MYMYSKFSLIHQQMQLFSKNLADFNELGGLSKSMCNLCTSMNSHTKLMVDMGFGGSSGGGLMRIHSIIKE